METDLTGAIPPELGGMANLRELNLSGVTRLDGPLPAELAGLARLEALLVGGTKICAPSDPVLLRWLAGVYKQRVPSCEVVEGSTAGPIPTELDEGDLARSSNADIPATVMRPGLEVVIEIDPDGDLAPNLGVTRRIPESGRLLLDVREMPRLKLTLVPFLWEEDPDSAVIEITRGMAREPQQHEVFSDTRTLMPVELIDPMLHAPVVISSNHMGSLLRRTEVIRRAEGVAWRYMGLMSGEVAGGNGRANDANTVSVSIPRSDVVAHELGHNFSLYHAPCGSAPGPDPAYPYADGSIGSWGYDPASGRLVNPGTPDLMAYCDPPWVGEYHYANALRYRLRPGGPEGIPRGRPPGPVGSPLGRARCPRQAVP